MKKEVSVPADDASVCAELERASKNLSALGLVEADVWESLIFHGLDGLMTSDVPDREKLRDLYYLRWSIDDAMQEIAGKADDLATVTPELARAIEKANRPN